MQGVRLWPPWELDWLLDDIMECVGSWPWNSGTSFMASPVGGWGGVNAVDGLGDLVCSWGGKVLHSLVSFPRPLHRLDLFREISSTKFRKISESHRTPESLLVLLLYGGKERKRWGQKENWNPLMTCFGSSDFDGQSAEVSGYPASQHGVRKTAHQ